MKRSFSVLCFAFGLLFAKADFSEMSTEELVAMIGYVEQSKEAHFYKELEQRTHQMSEAQKALYEEDKKRRDNVKN